MTSRITIAVVLIAVLTAIVFAVQTFQARSRVFVLQVATSAKDGDYYACAQALKSLVERHNKNVRLEVVHLIVRNGAGIRGLAETRHGQRIARRHRSG